MNERNIILTVISINLDKLVYYKLKKEIININMNELNIILTVISSLKTRLLQIKKRNHKHKYE